MSVGEESEPETPRDKYAPLFAITRDSFTRAFEDESITLLANLKHYDLGRFHELWERWKKEKFPGLSDLTKRVNARLAAAKAHGKEKERTRYEAELRKRATEGGAAGLKVSDFRGTALRFLQDIRPNLIYCNGTWLDYEQNRYVEVEDQHVRSDLWNYLAHAIDMDSAKPVMPTPAMVTSVTDALNGLCFRESRAFSPPAWLHPQPDDPPAAEIIACGNGLLHLPTEKLLDLSPRFFTYNGLPYSYEEPFLDPGPREWLQFLEGIWPESPESIDALQEIFGYLLTNDTSQQKIFLIVGPPRSGKGTIGRVLTALLGKENCSSPSLKALGKDFGMQSLIGKQLMLVSDMRMGRNTDTGEITGNLLRISGEDDVNIARKFKEDWRGKLPTRILLLSNVQLILPDMSGALINRLVPLVIKESFLGREDTGLTNRLLAELPSILNWAIEGWKRLQERGHFALTEGGAELNSYASSQAAPVQVFLNECCETGSTLKVGKRTLFAAFELWAEEMDVARSFDSSAFSRELRVASGYRLGTSRPRGAGGKQVPHYVGVALTAAWAEQLEYGIRDGKVFVEP